MTVKRYSFGICSWCFPADQETACGLAAEIGLDGMEIDIGAIEDGLPLADPDRQRLDSSGELLSGWRRYDRRGFYSRTRP